MAHPFKHAQSSAKRFGGTPEFTTGLINRKRSLLTSVTAPFVTTRKEFFSARTSSASRSPTVKGSRSQCGTSESSTLRKIWGEFRPLKIGSHKSSLNAGCMGSD